jgi:predicted peroxiredoxin
LNTLFIIGRAKSETAFRIAKELHSDANNVTIIFTGRGVNHILNTETIFYLNFAELYTIESEYNSTNTKVMAIGYEKFVKLLEESERTFTWI